MVKMGRTVGLKARDIVLAVADSPPIIWSSIPYLWTYSEASKFLRLEFITASLDWYDTLGMTWIDFIQRRPPTVLFSSIKNALALADKIERDIKVQPRKVLTSIRIGIFYGEPLEKTRKQLIDKYSLEPFEIYSPTEFMSFCTECKAHKGIHLWMDTCIPEIITPYSEDAIPIWETSPGTKGELVITSFTECLPLIRYRTEELVCVEGIDRCICGITHPRISRLSKNRKNINDVDQSS